MAIEQTPQHVEIGLLVKATFLVGQIAKHARRTGAVKRAHGVDTPVGAAAVFVETLVDILVNRKFLVKIHQIYTIN